MSKSKSEPTNYMQADELIAAIESPELAEKEFRTWGLQNPSRGRRNLESILQCGVTKDLLSVMANQLARLLPECSDPDMALNNFDRFVNASRSPLALGALIERDGTSLPILLKMFSTSQHLSDLLVRDPESYDLLRLTEGLPVPRAMLIADLCSELEPVADLPLAMSILRRFKNREILRVAYGDIIGRQTIESTTSQLSYIADAVCEAAWRFANRRAVEKHGVPRTNQQQIAKMVILALGKHGGSELNYSSDIDLMMLYDLDGRTDGKHSLGNREFFERVIRDFVKLVSEQTELGFCYRVDLRLRPEGSQGPLIISFANAMQYYDLMGRTWERQAFVKARPIAGDISFGEEFLKQLEPWIYRRYLSRADITGIKALKRKIEQRVSSEGEDDRNVKTGHGGIRDIEFVIQFLQLLNGSELATVRTGNTLQAIAQLETAGCLMSQERVILERNYAFLRKTEHRLQIMFDLQTHTLPDIPSEIEKLARRLGYVERNRATAGELFREDYEKCTKLNRRILDHLLHNAFSDSEQTEPIIDLVLEAEPDSDKIQLVLGGFGFHDPRQAYQNLISLSRERNRFLSTRRCRHFLAAIASSLMQEIARTPDPDFTLMNLSQVSDSLGGKAVLWELFSVNPPSLNLYVTLCASSPYLSGILISNPGMIDELMDSLFLNRLPSRDQLDHELNELCGAAEDIDPIVHGFKNSHHLRVGVRDILGRDDIRQTHQALSDISESCLCRIAQHELEPLEERYGRPEIQDGNGKRPCEMVILAMGKLGGQEPNYHSDLDVVFLFEAEGQTKHSKPEKTTSNHHFFSQLGSRISKIVNHFGPLGRLYELDSRLRPTGRSGALVTSFEEFLRYFTEGNGQFWERQALCKARPLFASHATCSKAAALVREAINSHPWLPEHARSISDMRARMQEGATGSNLKRGLGGTVDIEFAIQILQLRYQAEHPEILVPNTLAAIDALYQSKLIDRDHFDFWTGSYRYLRNVEARLRLMNTTARHDLPEDPRELDRLAYLLKVSSRHALIEQCEALRRENRERFDRLVNRLSSE
jgi:[glutamine synthetase] adenylyltransferase / [glutamine synthetase]-adenylyl-L-tyrosine phosphorylase